MPKTKSTTKTKSAANRPKSANSKLTSSKVDELKLGKFSDCEPLRLPEFRPRRSWQIIGAVALLLITIFCVGSMIMKFPFAYLWHGEQNLWQPDTIPLTVSWIINNVALVIFTILCLSSSIILFLRRRVPTLIWYLLIVTLLISFISQSISIYQNYTLYDCGDDPCPLVVGELGTILLCNLVIFMISLILLCMVYRTNHYRMRRHHRKN